MASTIQTNVGRPQEPRTRSKPSTRAPGNTVAEPQDEQRQAAQEYCREQGGNMMSKQQHPGGATHRLRRSLVWLASTATLLQGCVLFEEIDKPVFRHDEAEDAEVVEEEDTSIEDTRRDTSIVETDTREVVDTREPRDTRDTREPPDTVATVCTEPGTHLCDGVCLSNTDSKSCGNRCTACLPPKNGFKATCDGIDCGFSCNPGFHRCTPTQQGCDPSNSNCTDACLSDSSTASCGTNCRTCPDVVDGRPECRDGRCTAACNAGFRFCDNPGTCVSNSQPCGTLICGPGTHLCPGQCLPNNDPNTCGSRCQPCPLPVGGKVATCDNGSQCSFVCLDGRHKCGNECPAVDSVDQCGDSCMKCPPPPSNGRAVCTQGRCDIVCNTGYTSCGQTCVLSGTNCKCPLNGQWSCGSACIDQSAPCDRDCYLGRHLCGTTCELDNDVSACGAACVSCPMPVGATSRSCNNGTCEVVCGTGFHPCAGGCAPDVPGACGNACDPECPLPTNGASTTCTLNRCGFTCKPGFHACGDSCYADTDSNHCESDCKSCSVPTGGAATCVANVCTPSCTTADTKYCALTNSCIPVASTCCPAGQHGCSGVCVSDSAPETCGSRCTPCPPTINGTSECRAIESTTQYACIPTCAAPLRACGLSCIEPGQCCSSVECPTGVQCLADHTCDGGCRKGWADCDEVPGCETALGSATSCPMTCDAGADCGT